MNKKPDQWTIICDQPITRRKRFHLVIDPEGKTQWRSMLLWDCVLWLDEQDVECYELRASLENEGRQISRLFVTKDFKQWQN